MSRYTDLLLVGENEFTLSPLRFTLVNSRPYLSAGCYRVDTAKTAQDALQALVEKEYRLMLVQPPVASLGELVAQATAIGANTPTLILTNTKPPEGQVYPENILYKPSNARILEMVAVMIQRKRGPRKGSPGAMRCGPGHLTASEGR